MAEESVKPILTVMLAVDSSEQAEEAFDFYANTLHIPGNRVILAHVPERNSAKVAASEGLHLPDGEWQKMRDDEKKETADMVRKYADKVASKGITNSEYKTVYASKPGEAICDAAKELDVALIVIGSRGLGAVRRTIMGSVSNYVLHHAHVPVIICRHHK